MLKNKNIIVGVTGSIAAYKTAILVRLLIREGAQVKVIMTPLAKEFITPLTLATLSRNPILIDFFNPENGDWNSHVDLGLWADAYLIAPATANTIGKMAAGIADNLLLTTYLSARCPVFIAPAMDMDMYDHPATQKNIDVLKTYGNHILEPSAGELASGLEGKGRMTEPDAIVSDLQLFFEKNQSLKKKRILVTAGPTYEKIDPVRFVGNYSSGKMGYAIAQALAEKGAEVELVSGPVNINVHHPNIKIHPVESAREMHEACMTLWSEMNGAFLVAAVADYTPAEYKDKKIKKDSDVLNLPLKATIDIAETLGKNKGERFLAGFALETDDEIENAKGKMKRKNFDFIVLNSLQDQQATFAYDTNKISILDNKNNLVQFDLKEKQAVANDIVAYLCKMKGYA